MIKILKSNIYVVGHEADYILENGVILFECNWNGEYYDCNNKCYYPVYAVFYNNDIPVQWDIIGFTNDKDEALSK